jgi:hypothetical protein
VATEAVESQGFFAPNGAQNDINVKKLSTHKHVILSEAKDPYDVATEAVESQGFFAPNGPQNDINGEKVSVL